jgi:hypothetical protein
MILCGEAMSPLAGRRWGRSGSVIPSHGRGCSICSSVFFNLPLRARLDFGSRLASIRTRPPDC